MGYSGFLLFGECRRTRVEVFSDKDVIALIQRGANALLSGDNVYEKEGMRFILKKE